MWHLTTITHKLTQSLNSKILVLMVTVVVMGDNSCLPLLELE
jgi:hypothetical protein